MLWGPLQKGAAEGKTIAPSLEIWFHFDIEAIFYCCKKGPFIFSMINLWQQKKSRKHPRWWKLFKRYIPYIIYIMSFCRHLLVLVWLYGTTKCFEREGYLSVKCSSTSCWKHPAVTVWLFSSSILTLHHVYLATSITHGWPFYWSNENAPETNGRAVAMVQCVVAGWNIAARHVNLRVCLPFLL